MIMYQHTDTERISTINLQSSAIDLPTIINHLNDVQPDKTTNADVSTIIQTHADASQMDA